MSAWAIRVSGLGKQYRIGAARSRYSYQSLRENLTQAILAPFRRVRAEAFEYIWALKEVAFEIKAGEVVGVIGRNGAGKSTLLKVLSQITEPTAGEVRLRGRVGSLLEVGTGFHPELTGRENIYLNGAILGMARREIRRKFDEIVGFAETEKFIDTPVKFYSSGMYMRLAFAVAAHLEPEILLVDEVLAVGDAQFQQKCLGKMGEVAKGGRTVVFVSHNMNAIEQLCREVMLLERGQLVRTSTDVRSVITDYLFGRGGADMLASEWRNVRGEYANPWFRPERFFICDSAGQALGMPVSNDAEMWVQIEAEVEIVDPALTVGYAIYSETGTLLYWSYQTDQAPARGLELRRGRCVLRGKLPSRLLNEGAYHLELIGGLHYRQWLFEPGVQAPSIRLQIQGGLSDSPYWMVKRPGELAPVLEWRLVA